MNTISVKDIRKKLGISQIELAKKLGVHPRTIQNWEAGGEIPQTKYAILCELIPKEQQYYGGEVDQSNVNGDNIQGNHVTVNKYVEELMERLKSRDEALMKAQEQMDRLLAIIDNLTRQH